MGFGGSKLEKSIADFGGNERYMGFENVSITSSLIENRSELTTDETGMYNLESWCSLLFFFSGTSSNGIRSIIIILFHDTIFNEYNRSVCFLFTSLSSTEILAIAIQYCKPCTFVCLFESKC